MRRAHLCSPAAHPPYSYKSEAAADIDYSVNGDSHSIGANSDSSVYSSLRYLAAL